MGWRGAVRTLGAIARAAERDARRRAREQARRFAEIEKIEARERAIEAVHEFEDFLQSLVSAHRTCSKSIDWHARATMSPPTPPERTSDRENAAKHKLVCYSPSFLSRLLRRVEAERNMLEQDVAASRIADDVEFAERKKAFEQNLAKYEDEKELAGEILANDPEAMLEYIKVLNPFGSIAQLGESLNIHIPSPNRVAIELDVHGQEVIPKETARLLASGRISRKPMPKGEYFRLYQDHVCSAALRVAREVLAALPVDSVVVTAVDELVDSSTGNLAKNAVLSFLAPRATLDRLNFDSLDPSDAMRNFLHQMDFRTTAGFRPIQPLDPKDAGAPK